MRWEDVGGRQRTATDEVNYPLRFEQGGVFEQCLAAGNLAGKFERLVCKSLNRLPNALELESSPGHQNIFNFQ
jgi:hypothetical protein